MKKKLVSVLLTAAMVASLVGCGGSKEEAPAETTEKTEASAEKAETPAENAEAPVMVHGQQQQTTDRQILKSSGKMQQALTLKSSSLTIPVMQMQLDVFSQVAIILTLSL